MKKTLLIILTSLLGFTGFAQVIPGYVDGCISHKIPTGGSVVDHFYVITLDATAGGAPMDLYMNSTGPYSQASAPVAAGSNWVYEFDLGPLGMMDFPCRNVQVFPAGMTYDPNATFHQVCHCDWDIKDACLYIRFVAGHLSRFATITFDADVQGVDQYLWYWDGSAMQSPTLISKYFNGTHWIYTYDFTAVTMLPMPLNLYVTGDPSVTPGINDPHFSANSCHAEMKYACYELKPLRIGMPWHRVVTVVYDAGISGQDVYLWWWNGGFSGGFLPISKVFVGGYWKYTYDLGPASFTEPPCWELYPTLDNTPPIQGTDPHSMACKCGECDASFGYCINSNDPYVVTFDLNMPNPLNTITIKVDGVIVYIGPALTLNYDFGGPGTHDVCISMNDQCQFCIPICLEQQGQGE